MDNTIHHYVLPWISQNYHARMEKYLEQGELCAYKEGDIISLQGEIEKNVVYLTKGSVKVSGITEEGNEKIFWYNKAPSLIGEVSFFDAQFSNASIVACEDSMGYVFSGEEFCSWLEKDTKLHTEVTTGVAMKIRILISQILEISHGKPQKQICRLIYFYALKHGEKAGDNVKINLNIPQKDIASLTSLHRSTVVKILAELKNEHILTVNNKNNIVIEDMAKLKEKTI